MAEPEQRGWQQGQEEDDRSHREGVAGVEQTRQAVDEHPHRLWMRRSRVEQRQLVTRVHPTVVALDHLDDDPRVTVIYAIPLPAQGLGRAINERLDRASS